MTVFVPNATVTVYRGTTTNAYGDVVDDLTAGAVVATGVPVAVATGVSSGLTGSAGRDAQNTGRSVDAREGGVTEQFTLRFRPGADITEQDRCEDERSGAVYLITATYNPLWTVGAADIRATAVRVAATSQPVNG
jgi:hypothetical protein